MNEERRPEENRGNGNWRVEGAGADQIDELVRDVDRWVRGFVRERPFTTVVAAVAAGFFLGRLLRR